MTITSQDFLAAQEASAAAQAAFGDQLSDSLTNEQSDWQCDGQQALHLPSGLAIGLPISYATYEISVVNGPAIQVSYPVREVIRARIAEITVKSETAKLDD